MKKMARFLMIALVVACIVCISGCDGNRKPYEAAKAQMAAGEFAAAAEAFELLGDYEDSADLALCCRAVLPGMEGDHAAAIEALLALEGRGGSAKYVAYFTARQYEDEAMNGSARAFIDAGRIYAVVPGLLDADERADTLESAAVVKTADEIYGFSEGLARFECDGLYGFIDAAGNIVVEPVWENAEDISGGLAAVCLGGKWGYIDAAGSVVIEPQWDICGPFSEGFAMVGMYGEGGAACGFIDAAGNIVIEPIYATAGSFSCGRAKVSVGEKAGYIDAAGDVKVDFSYDSCDDFSEEMAAVCVDGRWGYIDTEGNIVIAPQWDRVGSFSQGRAWVAVGELIGYVDTEGNYVVTPQCSTASDYSEGYARVVQYDHVGYFDLDGKLAYIGKDWENGYSFREGRALVRIGDEYGYIGGDFTVVIDIQYTAAHNFSGGVAPVCVGGVWSLIDTDGNRVF